MANSHHETSKRECIKYDVLIVGGGPAGLAAAIRLKQLAQQYHREISVCVLEKAAEIGTHILSGALFDPKALDELLPDWQEKGAPLNTPVREEQMLWLTEKKHVSIPRWLLPQTMHHKGCYIVRLGFFVRWLGQQAEALGVEIFPGFAASKLCYSQHGAVCGILTGDVGMTSDGGKSQHYQPGIKILAKYTLLAEGCRGHLSQQVEKRFQLRDNNTCASYSIGLKELWELPNQHHAHQPGLVVHSVGWPMDLKTYGGGFIYHLHDHLIAIGYVVGLDYQNPYLSPYQEFQRFKTHPRVRSYLTQGKRLAYGARAIATGGLPSLPRLIFPGGALIGDDAGFLNPARLKGSHSAIKSGHLAAESTFQALIEERSHDLLSTFPEAFQRSWLYRELYRSRNFKPYFKKSLWQGALMFGIEQKIFRGKSPWILHNQPDPIQLKPAEHCPTISYPKPDGIFSFDLPSSVFLSNTNHDPHQPCHLHLQDPTIATRINLTTYAAPEQYYCPAGVYEIIIEKNHPPRLHINASSCIHCKVCDIKDPTQNITWQPPQGGEGPIYTGM